MLSARNGERRLTETLINRESPLSEVRSSLTEHLL
jgi:hypothetical protein